MSSRSLAASRRQAARREPTTAWRSSTSGRRRCGVGRSHPAAHGCRTACSFVAPASNQNDAVRLPPSVADVSLLRRPGRRRRVQPRHVEHALHLWSRPAFRAGSRSERNGDRLRGRARPQRPQRPAHLGDTARLVQPLPAGLSLKAGAWAERQANSRSPIEIDQAAGMASIPMLEPMRGVAGSAAIDRLQQERLVTLQRRDRRHQCQRPACRPHEPRACGLHRGHRAAADRHAVGTTVPAAIGLHPDAG